MIINDILNSFSVPIYCGGVTDFNLIQNELDTCIGKVDFSMNDKWGSTHYLSDTSFNSNIIEDLNLEYFSKEIGIHVEEYCNKLNFNNIPNYKIISSWFALFRKGNYAHIHNHGDSDIAGVYYYKRSGNDGNLFFCSPNKAADTSVLFMNNRLVTNTKEGEIVLFPGFLDHGVQTNDSDDERVSLSFNIYFDR
tara:strand:- start:92 stop:670 length:579 start_codon:yes stop_codon:yes gene_type:complete